MKTTGKTAGKTATNTKRQGWRKTRRRGESVLIDPAGRIIHGTAKDVREAVSDYALVGCADGLSLLRITLRTGRTHQIRAQFSHHGLPLVGDRKYGTLTDGDAPLALWSHALGFFHPETGRRMDFTLPPPQTRPWTAFAKEAAP